MSIECDNYTAVNDSPYPLCGNRDCGESYTCQLSAHYEPEDSDSPAAGGI
jgi:hypothetical protein